MFDKPANIEHWEHFHGFPDGKQAHVPTLMQYVNHDGYLVADKYGHYEYDKDVPLAGNIMSYDAHTTLPIAAGEIKLAH